MLTNDEEELITSNYAIRTHLQSWKRSPLNSSNSGINQNIHLLSPGKYLISKHVPAKNEKLSKWSRASYNFPSQTRFIPLQNVQAKNWEAFLTEHLSRTGNDFIEIFSSARVRTKSIALLILSPDDARFVFRIWSTVGSFPSAAPRPTCFNWLMPSLPSQQHWANPYHGFHAS